MMMYLTLLHLDRRALQRNLTFDEYHMHVGSMFSYFYVHIQMIAALILSQGLPHDLKSLSAS